MSFLSDLQKESPEKTAAALDVLEQYLAMEGVMATVYSMRRAATGVAPTSHEVMVDVVIAAKRELARRGYEHVVDDFTLMSCTRDLMMTEQGTAAARLDVMGPEVFRRMLGLAGADLTTMFVELRKAVAS